MRITQFTVLKKDPLAGSLLDRWVFGFGRRRTENGKRKTVAPYSLIPLRVDDSPLISHTATCPLRSR
jgi:hypothetical protein